MLTRRDYLKYTALAGAGLTIQPGLLQALEGGMAGLHHMFSGQARLVGQTATKEYFA